MSLGRILNPVVIEPVKLGWQWPTTPSMQICTNGLKLAATGAAGRADIALSESVGCARLGFLKLLLVLALFLCLFCCNDFRLPLLSAQQNKTTTCLLGRASDQSGMGIRGASSVIRVCIASRKIRFVSD